MELFERGAYYGMNSVLAIYLSNKVADGGLGFDKQSIGFLGLQEVVWVDLVLGLCSLCRTA
jgi:dipeptide/tripeptide permease